MAQSFIDYIPGSLLPNCSLDDIRRFERSVSAHREVETKFPESYIAHVLEHHGGIPARPFFKTKRRTIRVVGRFLNFLSPAQIVGPVIPTWRRGVSQTSPDRCDDIRLDYSIWDNSHDSPPHDQCLPSNLVAFAGIDTAGHDCRAMAEFDLLCFKYSGKKMVGIVIWSFHGSRGWWQTHEKVASTFEEFCDNLAPCPAGFKFDLDEATSF